MPITCKDWNWVPVTLTPKQKEALLGYPTTIKPSSVKEVKVSSLDVKGLRQDVVHISWKHVRQPDLNVDLFLSHKKYHSILNQKKS